MAATVYSDVPGSATLKELEKLKAQITELEERNAHLEELAQAREQAEKLVVNGSGEPDIEAKISEEQHKAELDVLNAQLEEHRAKLANLEDTVRISV